MAHYAFLDENNVVTEVIAGRNEDEVVQEVSDWEEWYGNFRNQKCVRTSYNNKIRKQFAYPGFTYDEVNDVFICPRPFPSWTLDSNFDWQPPVPKPTTDGSWEWDEELGTWTD